MDCFGQRLAIFEGCVTADRAEADILFRSVRFAQVLGN
jgi:hypothetical protein